MPDLWLDVDTALSEVPVNIAPLIDDTDFKSIEGAVAYNAAGMTLFWHFVTTGGAYTLTAVTPTTGGNYDWTDQGAAGIYTIEIPASGGASINNDTEGFGWFTGVATGVLPWRGPTIGFRAAALNNSLIDGTTIDVNVTAMAAGTVTASAIATGAIDADAIASDAITSAKVADGFITAAKLASDAITAAKIASDAITAAKIATGAIDADALATDAVEEIAAALGVVSYGALDAGAASGGTFPAGQRANVASGDAVYVVGKGGARIIASGYNSTTGVFTTVSAFDSAAAASDTYRVFKLPKAEELQASDFADGFLTAAKIASDAITDAKVASDVTIASVTGAVGSVTGNVGGNVVGSVATVTGNVGGNVAGSVGSVTATVNANVTQLSGDSTAADNAEAFFDGTGYAGTGNVIPTVTSVTAIATGGITAGSIAADAIGASELAADAVAEIQSGLALSTQVDALEAAVIAIEADTQDIQARIPAALTAGGNIKADALALSGDTTAADNAESFFDGTGYAGTGNVIPTVTTLTNKTGFSLANPAGMQANTAFTNFEFYMVSSADHATPATGLTITATRSIDGGAFAACANSASEISAGLYKIDLAAADLNGTCITFKFTATNADATVITVITEP